MNVRLYERLPNRIEVNGRRYRVDFSFKKILYVFSVFQEDIRDVDKVLIAKRILIKNPFLSIQKSSEVIEALFESLQNKGDGEECIDFEQDAKLIYAAFKQTYGIDLYETDLHWYKFVSLLEGLPEDTMLSKVIDIRLRKLPKPTKYNAEERQALIKAKTKYAIRRSEKQKEKNWNKGLMDVASALIHMTGQKAPWE